MPPADDEAADFVAGFEAGAALTAGCGFDCARAGVEGFAALLAGPDFEGRS